MPVADWTVPFELTSTRYSGALLGLNQVVNFGAGLQGVYRLRGEGCALGNSVRETKDNIPQSDGAILHRRFLAGMEMGLAIQMWEPGDAIACDVLLQTMCDTLMGYLYGLLNAGDNEGRISWIPVELAPNPRMLDDIRLLSYPIGSQQGGQPYEIGVTVDCSLPYVEDLTQLNPAIPGVVVNRGNRFTYPVWQVPSGTFTLTNTDNGDTFSFDDGQPGCPTVTGFVEIDTLRNTATINNGGVLSNGAAGIVMTGSKFFTLPPGNTNIACSGGGAGLINAAWA